MKHVFSDVYKYEFIKGSMLKRIVIKLKNDIINIIGTNGSGKSSLIKLFSPLSITSTEFGNGGGTENHYEHNGSFYILRAVVNGKRVNYEFIKDGEELNTGHTGVVQDELAQQEFNYNRNIHRILTGKLEFSKMDIKQRTGLLMSLAPISIDQGLEVFNELKRRARSTKDVINHVSSRLVTESARLMSEDALKELMDSVVTYRSIVEAVIENAEVDTKTLSGTWEQRFNNQLSLLDGYATKILNTKVISKPFAEIKDLEDCASQKGNLTALAGRARERIDELANEHLQYSEIINLEVLNGENTITSYENMLASLFEQQAKLPEVPETLINSDAKEIATVMRDTQVRVVTAIRALASSSDCLIQSEEDLKTLKSTIERLKAAERTAMNVLDFARQRLEHHSSCETIECPKCNHEWKPQALDSLSMLLKSFNEAEEKVMSIESELEPFFMELESHQQACVLRDDLRLIVSEMDRAGRYVTTLVLDNIDKDLGVLSINSHMFERDYENLISQFNAANAHLLIRAEIETQTKLKVELEKIGAVVGFDNIAVRHEIILNKMDTLIIERENIKTQLANLEDFVKYVNTIYSLNIQMQEAYLALEEYFQNFKRQLRFELNAELYKTYQDKVASITSTINNVEIVEGIIENLKEQLAILDKEYTCCIMLGKELSPNTGLIAEQMNSFINLFIENLNRTIAMVWEYDLSLMACGNVDGKLDYNFPVNRPGMKPTKDIRNCSAGQQEIIDFATMLLVMQYLKINDYCLFIDEIGNYMDSTHIQNFFNTLRTLPSLGLCGQLVVISHVFGAAGNFQHTDVICLNGDNIEVPPTANDNVTLEYY